MTTKPLPPLYLAAELAARENLDRPDHDALDQLLDIADIAACGRLVASMTDDADLPIREALPRAARILNPNAYVPIGNYPPDVDALMAAIEGTDPIMRRFAAAQYFITFPRQDTSWAKPLPEFPTTLAPDGEVSYVAFVEGDKANVTVESVAKAEAPAAEPIPAAFPHDATDAHPIDSVPVGVMITTTAQTKADLPEGDPAAVLPIGTVVKNHDEGVTTITLPATDTRPAVTAEGNSFLHALENIWHHLVADARALLAKI